MFSLLGDETGSHVYIPKECEPFGGKGFSCFSGGEEDSVWLISILSIISEFLFCGAKQNKKQKNPFCTGRVHLALSHGPQGGRKAQGELVWLLV